MDIYGIIYIKINTRTRIGVLYIENAHRLRFSFTR